MHNVLIEFGPDGKARDTGLQFYHGSSNDVFDYIQVCGDQGGQEL